MTHLVLVFAAPFRKTPSIKTSFFPYTRPNTAEAEKRFPISCTGGCTRPARLAGAGRWRHPLRTVSEATLLMLRIVSQWQTY